MTSPQSMLPCTDILYSGLESSKYVESCHDIIDYGMSLTDLGLSMLLTCYVPRMVALADHPGAQADSAQA